MDEQESSSSLAFRRQRGRQGLVSMTYGRLSTLCGISPHLPMSGDFRPPDFRQFRTFYEYFMAWRDDGVSEVWSAYVIFAHRHKANALNDEETSSSSRLWLIRIWMI